MKTMQAKPEMLKASFSGRPIEVDRKSEILRGMVVAQEGIFKDWRGEFNERGLKEIIRLGNQSANGLKSRFTHPDASNDGLGKHLGRVRELTLGTTVDREGNKVKAVRGDLHFDPTAHDTPNGDLSGYVMGLAESDPDAISSSLVLTVQEDFRREKNGTLMKDEDGNDLPPLWIPTRLMASDIVSEGAAVDGLLSMQELTRLLSGEPGPELQKVLRWDNFVRLGSQILDGAFAGQRREVVEARVTEYLKRYLERRYGGDEIEPEEEPIPTPRLSALSARMDRMLARVHGCKT